MNGHVLDRAVACQDPAILCLRWLNQRCSGSIHASSEDLDLTAAAAPLPTAWDTQLYTARFRGIQQLDA